MTRDLTTASSDYLLKWPFEQSISPLKYIDTVRVKYENTYYHYMPFFDAHTIFSHNFTLVKVD